MIRLEFTVEETADLLETPFYGAGALGRWESAAARTGTYVEGGTFALVSGTSVYVVPDAAGIPGETWYRMRVSNAAGSSFGAYSAPILGGVDEWLTVTQLRQFVTSSLEDAPLQTLLDAAATAIVGVAGATGEITEHVSAWDGFYHRITVARPIAAITSVTEYAGGVETILAADDYRADGYVLTRLGYGTNPRWWFWGRHVVVVYTPADDTAERQRVQMELVKLDLNWKPGLTVQGVEGFTEQYAATYEQSRADILGTLGGASGGMVVVGG
jgi:hypothetical protein